MVGRITSQVEEKDSPDRETEAEAQGLGSRETYLAALDEAFSFGYAEFGDDPSYRTELLYKDLTEGGRLPLDFVEAQGKMAGLVDRLFMRRDRLEHAAVLAALRWVQRLANELPLDRLLKTLTDHTGDKAKAEVLSVLIGVLNQFPDLAHEVKTIVSDIHARASAEGTVSAGAVINQHHGHRVPDLDTAHDSELAQQKRSPQYGTGSDTTIAQMLSGLAGDLAIHTGHLKAEDANEGQIKASITPTVRKGAGAAFFLAAAAHGFYANAQKQQIADAGEKVDFITSGDAGTVCPTCAGYEDANPWTIESVPQIPVHGMCRCALHAAGAIT